MSPELIVYPFLFIALYVESFVLVTFLSAPARAARIRAALTTTPSVAVIVPCWDEEKTLAATTRSLLALNYPKEKLEIILINDGSTDRTKEAMEAFASYPQVRIIHKENGGKHTALNAGIATTTADLVGCLDADSFVEPDALRELVACFTDHRVAAATAAMSVHEPKTIWEHMQNAEYLFAIAFRHAFASMNGLYVTPGPFSFYRRTVIKELGGFRYGHQTEDMEMALRIQRAGYRIENAPKARVYTKVPPTLAGLITQRTRWTSGFLRNVLGEYRGLVGSYRQSVLGLLVLPTALLAVVSGIVLFLLMLGVFAFDTFSALQVRFGIPFSYAFLPQGPLFDWFYFPATFYLSLVALTLLVSIAFVVIGRRLSCVQGRLAPSLISYACLYGFIAPLWLIRATSDVALGKRRGWRA